jgi:hypothetical protein
MNRDTKSLLSVSLAAMDQPSTSKVDIPLKAYVDIRDDSRDSDTSVVVADSIPVTDGVAFNAFRWHGDTS